MQILLLKNWGYYLIFSLLFLSIICLSCSDDEPIEGLEEDEDQMEMEEPEVLFAEDFILDGGMKLVNYILPASDYNKFLIREAEYELVTNKVYEYFKDDFDFIFILTDEDEKPDDLYFGQARRVQSDIIGIGAETFDRTRAHGSDGALKLAIHLPVPRFIRTGPFLHEIAHYWGNQGFIPTTVGGHWGYSSVGGQLGGFDELIELGDNTYQGRFNGRDGFGTFANGGNTLPYSNVELYIMGLIGIEELESILVAENPESSGEGVFTADAVTTYTAEDMIDLHGQRSPLSDASQKVFKGITILLSTAPVSTDKIEAINSNLENFSRDAAPDDNWGRANNFWMATGGRATLDLEITDASFK